MTVDDVVAAVRWTRRRDDAIRDLVAQYKAEGMTYANAVTRVSTEVQDRLREQGWSDEEIRGAGVSYGNVRVICERR